MIHIVKGGGQWVSLYSVRLGMKGLLVQDSPPADSCYVLVQGTVSAAEYWLIPGRQEIDPT